MKGLIRAAAVVGIALMSVGATPNWLVTVSKTDGGHLLGNPNAKVKLTTFESYTCPHCANFEKEAAAELRISYIQSGKVSLEVRHALRDPVDLTAAMLTECVAPGKFFATHQAIFRNFDQIARTLTSSSKAQQDRWYAQDKAAARRAIASDFGFYPLVATQGLTRAQADQCLNNNALAQRLAEQDKADETKFKITGTPTFILNGVKLIATYDWSLLKPQIDARL
ncbi:thioredoxin domain-containing protein [Altererythrobacter fulvus]|uniref:thioredoxin domain-containing protein n=1 Tax=Caenibius fulvus TaxID=2126012 RepID=UPI003019C675